MRVAQPLVAVAGCAALDAASFSSRVLSSRFRGCLQLSGEFAVRRVGTASLFAPC